MRPSPRLLLMQVTGLCNSERSRRSIVSPTQFIDMYCERTDASFWSEPVNAMTNLSYLAGAWIVWRAVARVRWTLPGSVRSLPPMMAAVGLCSFLFHTLATVWAAVADQLTILLFGCVFLYAFLCQAAGVSRTPALIVAVLFGAASYYAPQLLPPGWLNRSGAYLPYLVGLLTMTAWLAAQRRDTARIFGGAVALFCVALVVRTGDQTWCAQFPLGTHFLWHVLTGGVLTVLALALLREAAPAR